MAFSAAGFLYAFDIRSAAGKFVGRLAHFLRRIGAILRESGIRDRRVRGLFGDAISWSAPACFAHAPAAANSRVRDSGTRGQAPRATPISHSHGAKQRTLQRTRAMHALPMVPGICLRSRCKKRIAEHGHSKGSFHRKLRVAYRVDRKSV